MKQWRQRIQMIDRKKAIRNGIVLCIICVILFSVFHSFRKKGKQETKQTYTVERVQRQDVETSLTGKGTIQPLEQYNVTALVKGEILEAPFQEGDTVKKGDLLYQISTKDVENGIQSAKLDLQKAKKSYQDAKEQYDELQEKVSVSGYIKELSVKKGSQVQAGSVIAEIYDDTSMDLEVLFPASKVKKSLIGKKARVYLDGLNETCSGKVIAVGSLRETTTGNVLSKQVTIRVKNPGGITSNTHATAKIGSLESSATGTFRAKVNEKITAQNTGKVATLLVKKGQYIKKGSSLYRLDQKNAQDAVKSSKIDLQKAELSLENQMSQLENYQIQAPISGEVILKNKKVGDKIDSSSADSSGGILATIYDLSALKFEMSIDELDIRKVSVGQKVEITADAVSGKTFYGKVQKIGLNSTTNNGVTTYPVMIRIKKTEELLPGMNVNGKIIIEKADQVVAVPSAALMPGNVVYRKVGNKQDKTPFSQETQKQKSGIPAGFEPVTVETGIIDDAWVEIQSGLTEGDQIYVPIVNVSGTGSEGMVMVQTGPGGGEAVEQSNDRPPRRH